MPGRGTRAARTLAISTISGNLADPRRTEHPADLDLTTAHPILTTAHPVLTGPLGPTRGAL
ncbi:hypothetical protein AB0O08_09425 [Streptomyces anulatus]|uniref:hypothetical protein n=1 Tax=Streptomyces anulatus TaxID=1892 RepID=UPI0034178C81